MSMDNLSAETRAAIATASKTAQSLGHRQVRPEHLLIGVFAAPDSIPAQVLMGYGLFSQIATARVAAVAPPGSVPAGSSLFSEQSKTVIADANRIAITHGRSGVDIASLTRAILACGDPMVVEVLAAVNVSPETVLAALDAATPAPETTPNPEANGGGGDGDGGGDGGGEEPTGAGDRAADPFAEPELAGGGTGAAGATMGGGAPTPRGKALTTFGEDLVARAREGAFDRISGRENELERVAIVLARRTKNNPVLIGEPGVGKTAVIEALAQRIADGTVPEILAGRPLVSLDLAGMLAGARFRGDFEERLKQTLAEAAAANAILFIDELHQAVGAGGGGGAMDATNILKPMLARGEVSLVGATTLDEYRKHIEADAALERRFQPVLVGEPSVPQTVDILSSLRPAYAGHHRVDITDAALTAAAQLADRCVTDRFLPDKAIDVLDEAGAAAGMRVLRAPAEVRALYLDRAEVRGSAAAAVEAGDLAAAAQLHTRLAELNDALAPHIAAAGDLGVVDAGHIADVISAMTGVPAGILGEGESERLRDMPARVGARVIGQPDAVDAVCRAVRRVRQGLAAGTRPTSFIFAGPTGVGKTELAKTLADDLFGDGADGRGAFIHLDMSEYAEKASVAKLFGAPPGYVGYEEGGQLTELVRRNPYAVVLLDEVEKAHPDVFDTLLQVLEDGRMTDGLGRTVNFGNTVVILTTNLGSGHQARAGVGFGGNDPASLHTAAAARAHEALKGHFRPEFLNRIDEVVVFRQLERADLNLIVGNLLAPTRAQLADRGIGLEVTAAAVGVLLAAGYDPAMGARPLRRAITRLLVDPLADALLDGTLGAGRSALADVDPADPARLRIAVTDTVDATPVPEVLAEPAPAL